MRQMKICGVIVLLLSLVGMACRLTSVTPASWSGTPTAQSIAATNTAIALTQQAGLGEVIIQPQTATPIEETPLETDNTPTPLPSIAMDGPWLVYPAPEGGALHAYDVAAGEVLEIILPEPIYTDDLRHGLSPDGSKLVVRAGSPLETDQLALYQINLPSTDATVLSPLLSISLQRKIVNEEGTRSFETFQAVTQPGGLAWSPDGRFLAFTAALHIESSDLYVVDTLNDRVDRLNGLYSHTITPFWSQDSNWLISQELGDSGQDGGWRSEVVMSLGVPNYDSQNTVYLPNSSSQREVFVGWINAQNFISYSLTAKGPDTIRQVNVDTQSTVIIFQGLFDHLVFDPVTKSLAISLGFELAGHQGMIGGVYLYKPDSPSFSLQQAGDWKRLSWDPAGIFVAAGMRGVFTFKPDGEGMLFPNEGDVRLSPNGQWMIAWGDGQSTTVGARLYQPDSTHHLQVIIESPVNEVLWRPDSKAFIVQSEGVLYRLTFPGLNLKEVATGFEETIPLDLIWVE